MCAASGPRQAETGDFAVVFSHPFPRAGLAIAAAAAPPCHLLRPGRSEKAALPRVLCVGVI